jgi:hypothetical protein
MLLGVRLAPSPPKTTTVKKPQDMQAGRNENRRTKAANRMDWRSVFETFKVGTRLQHQDDDDHLSFNCLYLNPVSTS